MKFVDDRDFLRWLLEVWLASDLHNISLDGFGGWGKKNGCKFLKVKVFYKGGKVNEIGDTMVLPIGLTHVTKK